MLVLDRVLLLKKKEKKFQVLPDSLLDVFCFWNLLLLAGRLSAAKKTCVFLTEASSPRALIHYQRDFEPLFTWLPRWISVHVNQELHCCPCALLISSQGELGSALIKQGLCAADVLE